METLLNYCAAAFIEIYKFWHLLCVAATYWKGPQSFQKYKPLPLAKLRESAERIDCAQSHWFIFYEDAEWGSPTIHLVAWATEAVTTDGMLLFPPSVLNSIKYETQPRVAPRYLRFPAKLGPVTGFKKGKLVGVQFHEPKDQRFAGWVWFHSIHFHTGGRIVMYNVKTPFITFWSPDLAVPQSDGTTLYVD